MNIQVTRWNLRETTPYLFLNYLHVDVFLLYIKLSRFSCFMQITPEESWLFFDKEASDLHNKVSTFFFESNHAVMTYNISRFVHLQDGQEPELKLQLLTRKMVTTIS